MKEQKEKKKCCKKLMKKLMESEKENAVLKYQLEQGKLNSEKMHSQAALRPVDVQPEIERKKSIQAAQEQPATPKPEDSGEAAKLLKETSRRCEAMQKQTEEKCWEREEESRRRCKEVEEEAWRQCKEAEAKAQEAEARAKEAEMKAKEAEKRAQEAEVKAKQAADDYWKELSTRLEDFYKMHEELRDVLSETAMN